MTVIDEQCQIAFDTLERYSGSKIEEFGSYLLLTNFPRYVDYFSEAKKVEIKEGAMFKTAHFPEEDISILDFKIGSPAAALVVDLIAFLPVKASLLLGMCGGLRRRYQVGEFFVPVAAIRGEGTSDFYFPAEVPSLANFVIQRGATHVLEERNEPYHVGITHTTNKRFWEFDQRFIERLKASRAQCIEMECATLFMASYSYQLPLGALLLISDLPLEKGGVKTKAQSEYVYENYTSKHVDLGISVLKRVDELLKHRAKGATRGQPTVWQ